MLIASEYEGGNFWMEITIFKSIVKIKNKWDINLHYLFVFMDDNNMFLSFNWQIESKYI